MNEFISSLHSFATRDALEGFMEKLAAAQKGRFCEVIFSERFSDSDFAEVVWRCYSWLFNYKPLNIETIPAFANYFENFLGPFIFGLNAHTEQQLQLVKLMKETNPHMPLRDFTAMLWNSTYPPLIAWAALDHTIINCTIINHEAKDSISRVIRTLGEAREFGYISGVERTKDKPLLVILMKDSWKEYKMPSIISMTFDLRRRCTIENVDGMADAYKKFQSHEYTIHEIEDGRQVETKVSYEIMLVRLTIPK